MAACAIHLSAVQELTGCQGYEKSIYEINGSILNDTELLYHLSRAQQHVFYLQNSKDWGERRTKYNPDILNESLTAVIKTMLYSIPMSFRGDAIINAMLIMTGR